MEVDGPVERPEAREMAERVAQRARLVSVVKDMESWLSEHVVYGD